MKKKEGKSVISLKLNNDSHTMGKCDFAVFCNRKYSKRLCDLKKEHSFLFIIFQPLR